MPAYLQMHRDSAMPEECFVLGKPIIVNNEVRSFQGHQLLGSDIDGLGVEPLQCTVRGNNTYKADLKSVHLRVEH